MPTDMKRYPKNWREISLDIRFNRAKGRCEWCGVQHGAIGLRDKEGNWYEMPMIKLMTEEKRSVLFGDRIYKQPTKIILTVHNIGIDYPDGRKGDPHDKMDVRPENLAALCQRCHLKADMPSHIANRKKTLAQRKEKKLEAIGQKKLL